MKIILNRAIEALLRVTSDEETRPALRNIHIDAKGRRKKGIAVATNGNILLTAPVKLKEKGTDAERMIPADFLRRFYKLTTKLLRRWEMNRAADDESLPQSWVEVQENKDGKNLILAESHGRQLAEHHLCDDTYPNAALVWPKFGKAYQPYVIGTMMLKQLLAAAAEMKGGQAGHEFIALWIPVEELGENGRRPASNIAALVRITCSNTEEVLDGLVMPCRGDAMDLTPPDPFKVWK